jgi:hypothetical protein
MSEPDDKLQCFPSPAGELSRARCPHSFLPMHRDNAGTARTVTGQVHSSHKFFLALKSCENVQMSYGDLVLCCQVQPPVL